MTTADMAMRMDPIYEPISRRFHENPDELADAFARAWFQADAPRHGSAGALSRAGGPRGGSDLADPVPPVTHHPIDERDIAALKARILGSGLPVSQLVSSAWASASTFRGSDLRGGANGARVRLAPQKDWEVNQPARLASVLETLESIQRSSTTRSPQRKEGLARGPDRPRRVRGRRAGGEQRRARGDGSVRAGPR